jgi:hypothetical protein
MWSRRRRPPIYLGGLQPNLEVEVEMEYLGDGIMEEIQL